MSIMIVEKDFAITKVISRRLRHTGYRIYAYDNGQKCLSAFEKQPVDVVIADRRMSKIDRLALVQRVKEMSPATEVITVTAYDDVDIATEALRAKMAGSFPDSVSLAKLMAFIKRKKRYQPLLREQDRFSTPSQPEEECWMIPDFVGKSQILQSLFESIRRLQRNGTTTVLITGESGTGKELIARAIHLKGPRAAGPFVPVNCSAIPSDLAESSFFGHVRGAFTGATGDRKGYFELADGGTLFLDEIGSMSPELQTKLLRILEDGVVKPVGGTKGKSVDVRILAATNADLQAHIASGAFRHDLYFRLARFPIVVPPLRDRREDIPLLADYFLHQFAAEMGIEKPLLSPEALSALSSHHFPGNVRELKNIIERAIIESGGANIGPEHVYITSIPATPEKDDLNQPLSYIDRMVQERDRIQRVLAQNQGNISATARQLGLSRQALHRRLKKYDIRRRPSR